MRFQVQFPEGWKTQNTPAAVVAVSPQEDAIIQLALAGNTPPREAASKFLSQEGIQPGQGSTFTIRLPEMEGQDEPAAESGRTARAERPESQERPGRPDRPERRDAAGVHEQGASA